MAFRLEQTLALAFLSGVLLWGNSPATQAAEPAAATSYSRNTPEASYWHNWTDARGVSHMTKCTFHTYALKSMSPPAGPQWQDLLSTGKAKVISTIQPPHWNGVWHPDPKVQWIIPLKGTWFVEAMDGTRVEMGPGDISLGEDQLSRPDGAGHKGHLAGNVGDGPVTLLVVQLENEAPTAGQPCRFQ